MRKILMSLMVLIVFCFSIVGLTGCDSRTGSPMLIVIDTKVSGSGESLPLEFQRVRGYDITQDGVVNDSDDLNHDGIVDSSDLIEHKDICLFEALEIEYKVYNKKDGSYIVENEWSSYKNFIRDGGKVSGFNLDRKAGTYEMVFSYLGVESEPVTYEIKEGK